MYVKRDFDMPGIDGERVTKSWDNFDCWALSSSENFLSMSPIHYNIEIKGNDDKTEYFIPWLALGSSLCSFLSQ